MAPERDHIDISAVEHRLQKTFDPCYDDVAGTGLHADLGDEHRIRPVGLSLFPDTGIAKISTPVSHLTLRRAEVHVNEGEDALEIRSEVGAEWALVLLYRNGTIVFTSGLQKQDPESHAPASIAGENATVIDVPEPQLETLRTPATEDAAEKDRVTLTGRVGYKPKFRTTPKGTLVGQFALAVGVHPADAPGDLQITFS